MLQGLQTFEQWNAAIANLILTECSRIELNSVSTSNIFILYFFGELYVRVYENNTDSALVCMYYIS